MGSFCIPPASATCFLSITQTRRDVATWVGRSVPFVCLYVCVFVYPTSSHQVLPPNLEHSDWSQTYTYRHASLYIWHQNALCRLTSHTFKKCQNQFSPSEILQCMLVVEICSPNSNTRLYKIFDGNLQGVRYDIDFGCDLLRLLRSSIYECSHSNSPANQDTGLGTGDLGPTGCRCV